jgi:hypothetical protein
MAKKKELLLDKRNHVLEIIERIIIEKIIALGNLILQDGFYLINPRVRLAFRKDWGVILFLFSP